ncbi:MAG TPA: hypothetical protein DEW35_04845 [Ruminococcaceae bacterium]|nr:hypothetical protein [Oscillospiraceae bacterium]
MINISSPAECCGCKTCVGVCPMNCIEMVEGTLGHLYPKVDLSKCSDCGLCESVCPMTGDISERANRQRFFAAFSVNPEMRKNGSSGGIFGTLSEYLTDNGYRVYAAAFDKDLNLVTTCAESKDGLSCLFKSKYLICDNQDKFEEMKTRLQNGDKVFYCSSPCLVAAFKKFLGKEYENLITADFICHGVPSLRFFKECMEFDRKKRYGGKKVLEYSFRVKKKNGATPHYFSVLLENGKRKTGYYFDSTFYAAFQKYISLRESCYECRFAKRNRVSDITLGDFHSVENYLSGINRFDGISSVIINTQKGQKVWDACNPMLSFFELDIEKLIADKVLFSGATGRPKETDGFIEVYEKDGVEGVYRKYLKSAFYLKNRFYYSLPSPVRRMIKNVKGLK